MNLETKAAFSARKNSFSEINSTSRLFLFFTSKSYFLLLLLSIFLTTHASAATWGVPSGELDARAGANTQNITVSSFGTFDIPTINGSTSGSVDTARNRLELTLVNDNRFLFDARSVSSTDQTASGSPNAQAISFFQIPLTLSEQARAFLTAETIKSAGAVSATIIVNSDPPGLTLSFNEDSDGMPVSNSRILAPGDYLVAANYTTLSLLPGTHISDANGTLTITALSDLDGDLVVGASDLAIWEAGYGTTPPASFLDGDMNGDLNVTGSDFLQWQRELGQVTISTAAASNVPEPTSILLVGIGLVLIFIGGIRS